MTAIYSTLGLARTLSDTLRERGLLGAFFFAGLFLAGATVVTLAWRVRPGGAEIGVGLGVATAYFFVFLRMLIPEERTHLIEYSVVAAFIYEALAERAGQGRRVPFPPLLAIVLAALVGVLDECLQALLPNRVFDSRDVLFNMLAAVMAVAGSVALKWARRRRGSAPSNRR
ncbi:MAG: VanZ family protein [Caldilineae bacterium]|nr:MAG: VanZ family protein [Caldilineae bacterium]